MATLLFSSLSVFCDSLHHTRSNMHSDKRDEATVLMLTNVLRILPDAHPHAWACSSGSKGYRALKETLQNGVPGHTLLIESGDLRDVESSEGQCCLVYDAIEDDMATVDEQRLPPTTTHVVVYTNMKYLPDYLLANCSGLEAVDLISLSQVTEVYEGFLRECTGLTSINLSPLSHITEVQGYFLAGCTGLTSVDLSPLSQLTEVHEIGRAHV